MDHEEQRALLTLTLAPGLGPALAGRAIGALGSARAVVEAEPGVLAQVHGVGRQRATRFKAAVLGLADGRVLDAELKLVDQMGARLVARSDADYPALLRHIPDPPPLIYQRGQLLADDAVALAIIGSRRCTQYGRQQADRVAALCAGAGLSIVSGGAYGIDAIVHRAVLRSGGRTIAVLGSGLAKPYPEAHTELFDQIVQSTGAVISELPMMAPPRPEHFPRRNRIISGLALGVLVIEAALRSGALVTARLAAEDHGREVMALPGRVDSATSAGCHKMIREGWASLVTSAAEVLDGLGQTGQLLQAGLPDGAAEPRPPGAGNLTDTQRRIVELLEEPCDLDRILASTGLAIQVIQSDLTMLEIRGLVVKSGSAFARRPAQAARSQAASSAI